MDIKTSSDIPIQNKKDVGSIESKEAKTAALDDSLVDLYNDLHSIRNELDLINYTRLNDNDLLREYQDKLLSIENEFKRDGIWNGKLKENKIPKGQAMIEAIFEQCHNVINNIQNKGESSSIALVDKSLHNVYHALVEIRDNLTKLRLKLMKSNKSPFNNPNPSIVYLMNGELQHYQHLLDELENENRGADGIWGPKDSLLKNNVLKGQAVLNELLDKSHALARQIALKIEHQFKTNPILSLYGADEADSGLAAALSSSSLSTKDVGELKTEVRESPYGYTIKATIPKEYSRNDLRVALHNQVLMIQAKHTMSRKDDSTFMRSSNFLSRSLHLKDKINTDGISSRYDQNQHMLIISIPKA